MSQTAVDLLLEIEKFAKAFAEANGEAEPIRVRAAGICFLKVGRNATHSFYFGVDEQGCLQQLCHGPEVSEGGGKLWCTRNCRRYTNWKALIAPREDFSGYWGHF
jgi:hypothetical protein